MAYPPSSSPQPSQPFSVYAPQQSTPRQPRRTGGPDQAGGFQGYLSQSQPYGTYQSQPYQAPSQYGTAGTVAPAPPPPRPAQEVAPQPTYTYTPDQARVQYESQFGALEPGEYERFLTASGWTPSQGNITQEQYQRGVNVLAGFRQQRGQLGVMPMPTLPQMPQDPRGLDVTTGQARQLLPGYQMDPGAQALQSQAGQTAQQQMGAGPTPQYGAFTAPGQVAQAGRNAILEQLAANPDVFGATEQAQLAEQQKEQLVNQQRQASERLSQLMTSRGLSSRGGAELLGQAGVEGDLMANLLAGQRDIALQSAQQNRAARQNVISAITGAQQADLDMASRGYQTGLEGFRTNMALDQQREQQRLNAAQFANLIGQQGFQNYLAQSGLNLQGVGITEQAEMARAAMARDNYNTLLDYLLRAREGEQRAGFNLRDLGLREQELNARIGGFLS